MAFRLDIEQSDDSTIRDGTITMTARVIDTDTEEEVTDDVIYLWEFPPENIGSLGMLSGHTMQMVTYNADGFGAAEVPANVFIKCTATISNVTPNADLISVTTLSDLEIDNVGVNMLITANVDGNYLYNGDTDSVGSGSTTLFTGFMDLNVHQIQWIESSRQLVLTRDPLDTDTMIDYWVSADNLEGSGARTVYVVTPSGTVIEFDNAFTSSLQVTNDSITFTIPAGDVDADIVEAMSGIRTGQRFVLGIGDSDTLEGLTSTAFRTVQVAILGELVSSTALFDRTFIRPIIDKINSSFINRIANNTAFNKLEGIDDKPRAAYGIIRFNIPTYDGDDNEQRYRPIIATVNIEDRVNGVTEFTDTDYIVMLQQVSSKTVGVGGRSFSTYSVHSKTTTSFKICYEEGVLPESFGDDFNPISNVTLSWFARGK